MTQEEPWPKYDLRSVDRHVQAIGILSASFNDLENQLLHFLKLFDGAPKEVVSFLFEKLPTEARLEWLLRLVDAHKPKPQKLQDCITAFARAYKACADNRNLIVHSRISAYFAADDTLMLTKRVRKHGQERHHDISLTLIRRVADEIHFWTGFGGHVLLFVLRRRRAAHHARNKRRGVKLIGPTTLPEISDPPVNLANLFQN